MLRPAMALYSRSFNSFPTQCQELKLALVRSACPPQRRPDRRSNFVECGSNELPWRSSTIAEVLEALPAMLIFMNRLLRFLIGLYATSTYHITSSSQSCRTSGARYLAIAVTRSPVLLDRGPVRSNRLGLFYIVTKTATKGLSLRCWAESLSPIRLISILFLWTKCHSH